MTTEILLAIIVCAILGIFAVLYCVFLAREPPRCHHCGRDLTDLHKRVAGIKFNYCSSECANKARAEWARTYYELAEEDNNDD